MIKSELIQVIASQNPHLRRLEVERAVKVVLDEIIHALSLGKRVELRGFGAFSVRMHDARDGRDPLTGNAVSFAAKLVPFFKIGKGLHDRLNAGQALNRVSIAIDAPDCAQEPLPPPI